MWRLHYAIARCARSDAIWHRTDGVAELPLKNKSKSLNFPKLRLFYVHKIL